MYIMCTMIIIENLQRNIWHSIIIHLRDFLTWKISFSFNCSCHVNNIYSMLQRSFQMYRKTDFKCIRFQYPNNWTSNRCAFTRIKSYHGYQKLPKVTMKQLFEKYTNNSFDISQLSKSILINLRNYDCKEPRRAFIKNTT